MWWWPLFRSNVTTESPFLYNLAAVLTSSSLNVNFAKHSLTCLRSKISLNLEAPCTTPSGLTHFGNSLPTLTALPHLNKSFTAWSTNSSCWSQLFWFRSHPVGGSVINGNRYPSPTTLIMNLDAPISSNNSARSLNLPNIIKWPPPIPSFSQPSPTAQASS